MYLSGWASVDGQDAGKMLLDIEARIGELYNVAMAQPTVSSKENI